MAKKSNLNLVGSSVFDPNDASPREAQRRVNILLGTGHHVGQKKNLKIYGSKIGLRWRGL